jgi:hypothetical protein
MQQFSSLLSRRLFTAQHVSGVLQFTIRSSVPAVAASGFTFVSWWQSCCLRGRAGGPDHRHTLVTSCSRLTVLFFPPHFSHKLQPLDRNVCGPLITYVNRACDTWIANHPGETMAIHNIPIIINRRLNFAAASTDIKAGFLVTVILTCICLRRRSLFKVAYLNRNSDVTRFCHIRMRAHYVVGVTVFRGVVHSYRTYSVLASRTTDASDSTAAAAFNRKNVEKVKIQIK